MSEEQFEGRWDSKRIARLGFFIGLGWCAKRIANDPIVASTPNNVHRVVQRFGLSFRVAAAMAKGDAFRLAAEKRGITREQLIDRLLGEIDSDPVLIDNILDDGVQTNA